jgi:alkylation response protein AidB-like acyl-CoA dehydrogenase
VSASSESDRHQLRAAVRDCLDRHAGPRPFLTDSAAADWFDAPLLKALNQGIGLPALLVPEALGGLGAGLADVVVVFEELGASLAPVPEFATVALATPALLAAPPSEDRDALLGRISGGLVTVALAGVGPGIPGDSGFTADLNEDHWLLSGELSLVIEGNSADVLLIPAHTPQGTTLFAVETSAVAVTCKPHSSMDLTRGLARISAAGVVGLPIGDFGAAEAILESAWDIGCIVLAAEQVGGAQHCLDGAVEYAKQRVQFGQPIGSFQAIMHQLVDLLLAVETARSALIYAVDAGERQFADPSVLHRQRLTVAASQAKSVCSGSYVTVADGALHIHGGIGFTWEHDSHLYWRRARSSAQLLGSAELHNERLAVGVGL